MKQKMLNQFAKNEKENAVYASMIEQSFAKLENENKDVFNEKFGISEVETLTKKEIKNLISEY